MGWLFFVVDSRPLAPFLSQRGVTDRFLAEADAQVAFLVKCGLASAVITEDSDILVRNPQVKDVLPSSRPTDCCCCYPTVRTTV